MQKKSFFSTLFFVIVIAAIVISLLIWSFRYSFDVITSILIQEVEDTFKKDIALKEIRIGFDQGRIGFRLYNLSLKNEAEDPQEIFSTQYIFVVLNFKSLFQKKVQIDRLYTFQPKLVITRDGPSEKSENISDILSDLLKDDCNDQVFTSSLSSTITPFLFKDRISIKKAEIIVENKAQGAAGKVSIRNLNVDIRNKMRSDLLVLKLSGQIHEPVHIGSFSLEGELKGLLDAQCLSELFVKLSLKFQDLALGSLIDYLPEKIGGQRLEGMLAGDFFYDGTLLLPGKGHVKLLSKDMIWHSSNIHFNTFTPSILEVDTLVDFNRDQIVLSESKIDVDGLKIHGKGNLAFTHNKLSFVDLDFKGKDLPLLRVKEYIPLNMLRSNVWPFLVKMIKGGEADMRINLVGKPDDFRLLETPQGEDAVRLWITFKNITVLLPLEEDYLPFREVYGFLKIRKGTMFLEDFHALYGKSPIIKADGTIFNIHQSKKQLQAAGKARLGDIQEVLDEMDHGIFPESVRLISRDMQQASGTGTLDLQAIYDFGMNEEKKLQLSGVARLEGVRAHYRRWGLSMNSVAGLLTFSDSSLSSVDIFLKVGNSPIQLNGQTRFVKSSQGSTGEIQFVCKQFIAKDFLPKSADMFNVEGDLSTEGKVFWKGWDWKWQAMVEGDQLNLSSDRYLVSLKDIRARLEGEDGLVLLHNLTCRNQGNTFAGKGEWKTLNPRMNQIKVQTSYLNLNNFFEEKKQDFPFEKDIEQETDPFLTLKDEAININFELSCDRLVYRYSYMDDAYIQGLFGPEKIVVQQARARVGDGRLSLYGHLIPGMEKMPFVLRFSLDQIDSKDISQWFSMNSLIVDGLFSMAGGLEGVYQKSPLWKNSLQGRISLFSNEGTIKRYDFLAKTLTLLNITQWSKVRPGDLTAVGIPYRRIEGTMQIEKGIMKNDFFIDSTIALVDIDGEYAYLSDDLDIELSIRPLEQLDIIIDRLPVVGKVIKGPDGSIVNICCQLTGPLQNPEVLLVPFKDLNNRIRNTPIPELNKWVKSIQKMFYKIDILQ